MDFTQLLVIETGPGMAAPYIGQILADFGARVVKIDSTHGVAFERVFAPGKAETGRKTMATMVPTKEWLNLNLKSEAGKAVFQQLVDQADVYIESYAPGWLERLGLSIDEMQRRNPRLIVMSQHPYGGDGPRADQRAFAPIMTALAGLESTVGYEDGEIVTQISSSVGDWVAAMYGTTLTLAALYEREQTGRGAILDMAQVEASAAAAGLAFAEYGLTGEVPRPRGNTSPYVAPHGFYPARGEETWVALVVWTDAEWAVLCDELELPADAREALASTQARLAARVRVDELVGERTRHRERDELVSRLQARSLSCTPVYAFPETRDRPEQRDRDVWTTLTPPDGDERRVVALPWHFSEQAFGRRAVALDTPKLLGELVGAGAGDLDEWARAGAFE